jgi:hypothetical protein
MKNAVIILLLALFPNLNGQKSKPSPCNWNANGKEELKIPIENYQYFNKGKIYYYVSNNNENIFLDMRIDDAETQNKILKQGLTVWINVDNKQIKNCSVRFPIGSQNPSGQGRQFQQEPSTAEGINPNSPVARANSIELTGFANAERRIIPSSNENNFNGSVHYNNEGVLIYKMIMPVSRIGTENNIYSDPVALGIEIGSPPMQMRPGPSQAGASGPPSGGGGGRPSGGGGGGSRSGGMGGGGFSSSGGAPPALPGSQAVILWIKDITLATEK